MRKAERALAAQGEVAYKRMVGVDVMRGSSGNDHLLAVDGEKDTLSCGEDFQSKAVPDHDLDFVELDLADLDPPGDCEEFSDGDRRDVPNVVIVTEHAGATDGRVPVSLRCPKRSKHRCKGSLRVQLAKRGASSGPAAHYSIGRGKSELVEVKLPRAVLGQLHGQGRAQIVATALEQGDHGPKTTAGRIRVRD